MDKNGFVIVLLLLFTIVFVQSNAFNSRKLVTNLVPNSSSIAHQDSPLSSPPPPDEKKPNLTSVDPPKSKDSPNTNPSNVESDGLNHDNNKTNSSDNGKQKVENQNLLKTFDNKSCKGNPICNDQEKTMTACIQDLENGSNKLTLVVQNDRDTILKLNITFGTSTNNNMSVFEIPSHKAEKVNITFSGDKSTKVILNAGNGVCELQMNQLKNPENTTNPKNAPNPSKVKEENDPSKVKEENDPSKPKKVETPTKPKEVEDAKNPKNVDLPEKPPKDVNDPISSKDENDPTAENLLYQLQLYSQKIEPIYRLYFGLLIAIIIGGSWVFCLQKRRNNGGVPYQELEMGLPESSNAVEVQTVEGWDHDWDDDDWDEDKAIRSPGGGLHTKSISSNGLTGRGTKKDGWDADWDD